ncbi:unnamed protein product [Cochlearia groenlandica]
MHHDHDDDDALRETSESMMMMTRQDNKDMNLKAKREDMKIIFTCPLCNNLFNHATTISECLHTFCRKCIQDKLTQEKLRACPVCKVDLGPAPLDKLRYDRSLEDLRLKVFKPKPKIKKASSTTATAKQYFRKKKRFPSPLEPEQVKAAVTLIATSSKPVSTFRKRQRKNSKPIRNEYQTETEQLHQESENGLVKEGTSQGCIQIMGNNSDNVNKEIPNIEDLVGKSLSIGKKAAPLKINEDTTAMIAEQTISIRQDKEKHKSVHKPRVETEELPVKVNENIASVISDDHSNLVKPNNSGEENQENVVSSRKIRVGKEKAKAYSPPVLRKRKKRNTNSPCVSVKLENKLEESNKPVWFSLVAAANQNKDRPLPQISPLYLRVNNGDLQVSYVKKYLVKKLNLESEDEVEIWLRQEPVCSAQKLQDLVNWWVHTTPMDERKSAIVGSSAAEFVMVLNYSRSQPYVSF